MAFFEMGVYNGDTGLDTIDLQVAHITDDSVFDDGSLFLKLYYDDISSEVSASIVFGNNEFGDAWEPFDKRTIPQLAATMEYSGWEIGARSYTTVPIPGAVWLLFSGLLGLIGFSIKAANRQTPAVATPPYAPPRPVPGA